MPPWLYILLFVVTVLIVLVYDRVGQNGNSVSAIAGETQLTSADSGGAFSITPNGNYTIQLPPTAKGLQFRFVVVAGFGNESVTISTHSAGGPTDGNHLYGNATTSNGADEMKLVQIFKQANIVIGDLTSGGTTVELNGIDDTHWYLRVASPGDTVTFTSS